MSETCESWERINPVNIIHGDKVKIFSTTGEQIVGKVLYGPDTSCLFGPWILAVVDEEGTEHLVRTGGPIEIARASSRPKSIESETRKGNKVPQGDLMSYHLEK